MLSYVFLAFATICAAVTAFGFDSKIYLFDAKGAFPVLIGSNAHYHLKVPRIKSRSSTYQHILHSSRANFNELISVVDEISMSDRLPEIIIANDSQIESSVENLTLKSNTSQINGNTLEILSFEVLGDPIPLARHRVSRGIMYNPAAKLQKQFAEKCSMYLPNEPLTGPLKAEIIFYFKRPLNHYRTGKMAHILKDNMDIWHVKKKGNYISSF